MLKAKISRNDLMGIYVFLLIQAVKMFVFSIIRYIGGRSSPAAFSAGASPAAGITSVLIIAIVFIMFKAEYHRFYRQWMNAFLSEIPLLS